MGSAGEREEYFCKRLYRLPPQKPRPAGGHHHRVNHHMPGLVPAKRRRHGVHGPLIRQHANFHRVWHNILKDTGQLFFQQLVRHRLHAADAQRILGGDRRHRRHPVYPVSRHRLEIRLDPRPAAAV